jgi:hypothetical protein
VAVGTERDRLLRLAAELDTELGCVSDDGDEQWAHTAGGSAALSAWSAEQMHILSEPDERLVVAFRDALGKVASGAWASRGGAMAEVEDLVPIGIVGGLDGAEFVMRGEILTGGIGRLWDLLPSFVYLVTVPIIGQEEALGLSRRTSEMLAAERGDGGGAAPSS